MTQQVRRPVLIVEDDETMRGALECMLDSNGYAARSVRSANEALTYLTKAAPPCLILLDLELPDVQGDAFYSAIRADAALADVPVIVFTGRTDPPPLPGVFATVFKVESPDVLMARIEAACRIDAYDSGTG